MLKTCPYSGITFEPKRKDQVFATPRERMKYHNEFAADLRRIKAPVDKALEKNFIILSEFLNEGDTQSFNKEFLIKKGYNTSYFTHIDNYQENFVMCLYHFYILTTENPNTLTVIYPKKNA